jgi:NAD(P)-dependent dehydrogenase (short-subunit alcohol dehydrogenase family)
LTHSFTGSRNHFAQKCREEINMTLNGTVAVTGAGSGMGQGIAAEFARRGYKVLALMEKEEQRPLIAEATQDVKDKIESVVLDITQPGDFEFPDDLAILVNNAGIRLKNIPIEAIPTEEWRLYFEVNFLGAVELTRRAVPIMRERHQGVICNINSGSITMPIPFLGPYRSMKGALMAFSETLRAEVALFGIRVVEILPGAVRTGMNKTSMTTGVSHASEYPPYAPMAEKQLASFKNADFKIIEIPEAANRIVDAILTGDHMRYGTCQASDAGIEAWRSGHGGEPLMKAFIDSLVP